MIQRSENALWRWSAWRSDTHGVWPSETLTFRVWREGEGVMSKGIVGEMIPFYRIDRQSHKIEDFYNESEEVWQNVIKYRYIDTIRDTFLAAKKCGLPKSTYFNELHHIHKSLTSLLD